jgi:Zinc knuckle
MKAFSIELMRCPPSQTLCTASGKEVVQMEIDNRIARVKALIAKREELDAELNELLCGVAREKRSPKCSICGEPGHRASTCPSKPTEAVAESPPN